MSAELRPYVPRLVIDWLREAPGLAHRQVDGTLVFADISGFTNLTERLARRGKVGAEEMGDLLNGIFAELLVPAYEYGAALIKWGGDAVLLLYQDEEHAARACRSATEMQRVIKRSGRLQTPAGSVTLRMSVGVHSGALDFFLVGERFRELVVTGAAATEVTLMEQIADAGEIVVSLATAALLDPQCVGARKDDGLLLAAAPETFPRPSPISSAQQLPDLALALSPPVLEHLSTNAGESEHRQVTAGFVQISGVDGSLAEQGADFVTDALRDLIDTAAAAAERYGVTLLGTDIARDGGKLILLGGAPRNLGDDDKRVVAAIMTILQWTGPLSLRAGATTGRVFMGDFGPSYRRTYSMVGDSVNLAARLMAKAAPGQLVVTHQIADQISGAFDVTAMAPFLVKGKTEPIDAFIVGRPIETVVEVPGEEQSLFVGRDTEVTALLDAAQSAREGHGAYVEVVGDPGMGKTRLVDEACRQIDDMPRHLVACDIYEASAPYSAVRRLLRAVLGLEMTSPEESGPLLHAVVSERCPEVLPWLPLIGSVLGADVDPTPEADALEERFRPARLAQAVADLLHGVLDVPTLVVFEDVHLMDDASCDAMRHLETVVPTAPWLLFATRRPDADGFVADHEADHVIVVSLTPLPDDATSKLLDSLTEDEPLPPHELQALRDHAGGNPLYLNELLGARRQVGSIEALPDSLEGVIAAQIDSLSPVARRVLRTAAILGMRVERVMLEQLLAEDDILPDAMTWSELATFFMADDLDVLRFRHMLVRETAYESQPYKRRRDLHGRVGDAIQRAGGEQTDEGRTALSFHFFSAQRYDAALRYSRLAGDSARRQYANVEAARFYQRALDSAQRLRAGAAVRAELAELMGEVCYLLGEFDKAGQLYRLARSLAGDDVITAARLRLRMAQVLSRASLYPQALQSLSRGLRSLERDASPDAYSWTAQLCAQYAFIRHMQGQDRETVRWAKRAIAAAVEGEADDALAQAYRLMDWAHISMGQFTHEQYAHDALAILERRGDLQGQAMVLNHLGMRAHFLGQWSAAIDGYQRSWELLERIGDQWNAAIAATNISEILVDQGNLTEAETTAKAALRVFRASKAPGFVAMATCVLGRVAARFGRFDEARELLTAAKEGFLEDGELPEALDTDARVAECLLLEARAEEALALADCTLDSVEAGNPRAAITPVLHRVRGYAYAQRGDPVGCFAALEASLVSARQRSARHDVALTLDAIVRVDDWEGLDPDPELVAERDTLFTQLGITSAPAVPLPGEALTIPEPRSTALSAAVEST